MKILITGATGQDGYYLAQRLRTDNEIYGLVQPHVGAHLGRSELDVLQEELPFVKPVAGDLTNVQSLIHALWWVRPWRIYNLAAVAVPSIEESLTTTMLEVNTMGTIHLLEAVAAVQEMAENWKPWVLHASSDSMFGKAEPPQDENTPLRPDSPYGLSKAMAHLAVQTYREARGVRCSTAILFNHTSERQPPTYLMPKVARAAALASRGQLKEKLLLGPATASRDWSHAEDVVEAMRLILEGSIPDDYVVGSGEPKTVECVCETAFRLVGLDYREYVEFAGGEDDGYRPQADPSKVRGRQGWRPKVTFVALVDRMVKSAQRELKGGEENEPV